jgi:serine/threonine protein kinase
MAKLIKIGEYFNSAEEKVASFLEKYLPDNYNIITNAAIHQGSKPYEIDVIVLSPHGIFVLEVKNWYGTWYQSGGIWITEDEMNTRNNPFNLLDTKARVLRSILTEFDADYKLISCLGFLVIPNDDKDSIFDIDSGYQKRLFRLNNELILALTSRKFLFREDAKPLNECDFTRICDRFLGSIRKPKNLFAGNWIIQEELGMSDKDNKITEYLAQHKTLDKKALVRIFDIPFNDKIKRNEILLRIKKEQKALEILENNDGILELLDSDTINENDNQIYIATKYTDWPKLSEIIKFKHVFNEIDAVKITINILKVLKSCHEKNILHRGLTPDCININIISKQVKISHFDLARIDSSSNKKGTFGFKIPISDLKFSSPEIIYGRTEYNASTDIYSVGKILLFILTGRIDIEIDKPINKIIQKCISLDQNIRYKNVDEVISGLECLSYPS